MPLIKGKVQASIEITTTIKDISLNDDEVLMVDAENNIFRISKEDFLAGISNNSSNFEIPTTIKTVADASDYFMGIDSTGALYKIAKSDLFAGLNGGSTPPSSSGSTDITLNFVSSGDANGLFYYLGTNKNTTTWSNPVSIPNTLIVTASSAEGGSLINLSDRVTSEFFSNIASNNWVRYQIFTGKLKCNYYSIKSRGINVDYYPRTWIFQGSNDGTAWIDLDTQINNISLASINQWLSLPVTSNVGYSYFRLFQNGVNSSNSGYFCLGEIELYGTYTP